MATVTVVTAERTLEIEATSIVAGDVNTEGHLILTRHDGTLIDVGAVSGMLAHNGTSYAKVDAFSYIGAVDPGAVVEGSVWYDTEGVAGPFSSETRQGLVELATNAEALAGVDTTRAVTPAGLSAGVTAGVDAGIAAIPGTRVIEIEYNSITESAAASAYPVGVSIMYLSSPAGWSLNGSEGTLVTVKSNQDRCYQTFYTRAGGTTGLPRMWTRSHHGADGGGGWTVWHQFQIMLNVSAAGTNQTTPYTAYPKGITRFYFTTSSGAGWDFSGKAGELITHLESNDFAKQIFTEHEGGAANVPQVWIRTATALSGWSGWRKAVFEDRTNKLPKAVLSGRTTVTPVANQQTMLRVDFPAGYFTATPNVVVAADSTAIGDTLQGVSMSNASTTGFEIWVRRSNTTNTVVQWTATQM